MSLRKRFCMSPNGSHQRPHAGISARGRVALNRALGSARPRPSTLWFTERCMCLLGGFVNYGMPLCSDIRPLIYRS